MKQWKMAGTLTGLVMAGVSSASVANDMNDASDAKAASGGTAPSAMSPGDDVAVLPTVAVARKKGSIAATSLATGQGGSLLETPFSVSKVSAELLREQGVTSLQDALRNVPGIQADSGFNGAHAQFFSIRGAVVDNGTGSSRVFRDGARLSNYPFTPAFVESIDVLRGPGAAIGVRSEPGGTVNIRTRQAEMRNFGSILMTVGGDREQELSVDVNRLLSEEDRLAVRLIGTRSNASEWRHVPDRLDGVKFGVTKEGAGLYELRAGIEVTNQAYRPDYGVPSLSGRPVAVPMDRQFGEPWADSRIRNQILDLHASVTVAPETTWSLDLTRLDAASRTVKNLLVGNMQAQAPIGTWGRSSSVDEGVTRSIDSVSSTLAGRLTLFELTHRWYAGLDYYREGLYQPSFSLPAGNTPPMNVFLPVYGQVRPPAPGQSLTRSLTTQDLYASGLSLQDQVSIGAWELVAGIRFDRQHFRFGNERIKPVRESRWSPKVALLRRLGETQTVYMNVSTGTAPNQVASVTGESLPSRHARQVEAGWKSRWMDDRIDLDLAVFRIDQTHMISSDLSTAGSGFTVAGTARSQGAEASIGGSLGEQVRVNLAYAYTDAQYGSNAVYADKRVPNVARHALNAWARYGWTENTWTGLSVALQGRRFAEEANLTTLSGYGRIDLVHAWSTRLSGEDQMTWQLSVKNLFDRQYYVSSHLHVGRWITPAQGRNWSISGAYRF